MLVEPMIWDHFQFLPFLAGLVFGVITITMRRPDDMMRVPKWPHPDSIGKYTYTDKNGFCYKFTAEEVDCDVQKESLHDYPYET